MTEIKTKTERRTRSSYAVLTRRPRQIVACFLPGDLIEFREAGCRHRWQLPIDDAFRIAIRIKAEALRREKRLAWKG